VPGTPETVELVLAVEVGAEPIRGSVRAPDGRRREFWGWLELAEIVQGASQPCPGAGRPGTPAITTTKEDR
jgi:hypothetical protein